MAAATATAPSHYIRSIHSSFAAPRTAAHSAAAWSARPQPPLLHTPLSKDAYYHHHSAAANQPYGQGISISTHNGHSYTHHLHLPPAPTYNHQPQGRYRKPSAAPAPNQHMGGRRRSASIRMPPPTTPAMAAYNAAPRGRMQAQQPAYKFDPFADDEPASAPLSVTAPLSDTSNRPTHYNHHQQAQAQEAVQPYPAQYTIHIPPANASEIQQYLASAPRSNPNTNNLPPPASPRPAHRTRPAHAALRSLMPINGPLPGTAPTATASSTTLRRSPSPPNPMTTLSRSPSPPSAAPAQMQMQNQVYAARPAPQPNLSKIVAGILLNRVHAVGRPMRRRVLPRCAEAEAEARGYRKSGLSSVVSVDA